MSRKHQIVGKDWAVAEAITQFLAEHGLGRAQHGNIEYQEIRRENVIARAKTRGPAFQADFEIALRKNPEYNLWEAYGEFTTCLTRLNDIIHLGCSKPRFSLKLGRYNLWVAMSVFGQYRFYWLGSDEFAQIRRTSSLAREYYARVRPEHA